MDESLASKRLKLRMDEGLDILRHGLTPYVERKMHARYGKEWRKYTSSSLDVQALLDTLQKNPGVFRYSDNVWRDISRVRNARNAVAHFTGQIGKRHALNYLGAMRKLLDTVGASEQAASLTRLYDEQRMADDARGEELPRHAPVPCAPAPNRTTGSAKFDQAQLRRLLVETAREGKTVTYGEIAALFNFRWSQGVGSALYAVLNRLAEENQDRQEPYLMALVVSKKNRLPGPGFFALVGHGPNSDVETYHKQFLEEVWAFDWPD